MSFLGKKMFLMNLEYESTRINHILSIIFVKQENYQMTRTYFLKGC